MLIIITIMSDKKTRRKMRYLAAIALCSSVVTIIATFAVKRWKDESERLRHQLEWQQTTIRNVDSLRTAEATALRVKASEIAAINAELAAEVERLHIANRRLAAAAAVHSVAYVRDTAYITDTLVIVQRADTAYIDTLQCLRWADMWAKVEACHRKGDTAADMMLSVADTLLLTVRREPRWRVLGIRIGTKGYTVAVRHTCPHVETQNVLFVKR